MPMSAFMIDRQALPDLLPCSYTAFAMARCPHYTLELLRTLW